MKKLFSTILVLMILFSNSTFVQANNEREQTEVSYGTFEDDGFYTNLKNPIGDASWNIGKNGASCNSTGDSFLLSESNGNNFVYEADVKFNERRGAASLVFRVEGDLDNKNMYVANLNGENGEARLFKFENNDAVDLAQPRRIELSSNNEYHLKVTVIDKHIVYYINDQLVLNTADYTMNSGHYGQNDVIDNGRFGLLTWNGNVSYQNLYYSEINDSNSPQLTGLSVSSIDGEVDKQISFSKGQYVYITYVTNATTAVKLIPKINNDSEIIVTNEKGEVVDINKLPVNKGLNSYTLTVRNGNAKVVYRIRVHKMQSDESYYNEDYRGQYHYSVKDGWGNDPCGLVYFNGQYHMFYQYTDNVKWGPMHWAHATSKDLITWEEGTIEFYPDEYGTMFSGCAVTADHSTAPTIFSEGEEGIVFFITANGTNGADGQRIIGAYSKDGKTFHKYDDGKVLIDWKDDGLRNMACRDPKVFRYENKWFMVIAGGPLRIYSSQNLVDWKEETLYGDLHTECPDLYPLEVTDSNGKKTGEIKWVLDRGGRKYKIGDFREVSGKWAFVPDEQYASTNANGMGNEDNDGIMNFGMDSYAAMTYYRGDFGTKDNFKAQDIIALNWMNTWEYGFNNAIPDHVNNDVFNGTYNLQCRLGVVKDNSGKYYLTQTPINEYETLRDEDHKTVLNNVEITKDNHVLSDFSGSSYEIVATIKPGSSEEVGFKVRTGDDEETVVKYNTRTNLMTIDRTKSGVIVVNDNNANIRSQKVVYKDDGTIDFHIYVDRSSVEVFSNDNKVAGAMQIFPSPLSQGLEVYSIGGKATGNITVYPLKTIWKDKLKPTKPLSITLNKTEISGYVGDELEIDGWISPIEESQDIVYSLSNNDVVDLKQEGSKAKLIAKASGQVIVSASSKNDPSIKKDCVVKIYKNNFKTNLTEFDAISGKWYIDGEDYKGSHNDNAFMFANKITTDKFKYEIDATYKSGILNFIFQSKNKNVWDGCYSVQLNGNKVRLFDFKNDYTFKETDTLIRPENNKYHIEIDVDGNKIVVKVNDKEYINHSITESDRQYKEGYVGLGLFNATAAYQNFYVTTNNPGFSVITSVNNLLPKINASIEDIKTMLPKTGVVVDKDGLIKNTEAKIIWNLSSINVNNPGVYKITGTADDIDTSINVTIRSNRALDKLVNQSFKEDEYTKETYENYLKSLNRTKEVLTNPDVAQSDIDGAYDELSAAINNLEKVVSVPEKPAEKPAEKPTEKPADQTSKTDKLVQKVNTGDSTALSIYVVLIAFSILSFLGMKKRKEQ